MFCKFLLVSALIIGGHCTPSPMFTTTAMAQDEVETINITIRNEFWVLKVSVYANGQYIGDVSPNNTSQMVVPSGAMLRFLPDTMGPFNMQAPGPGMYRVFPVVFTTSAEYLG